MTRRMFLNSAFAIPCLRLWAAGKAEEPLAVIVHPSNQFDSLSRSKVSFLFLRRVSRWPFGAEVVPVELAGRHKVRRDFISRILRTTEEQLDEYWIDQRATRGVSPPIQLPNGASVKAFVAARPGAIGYIPVSELDSTVKALKVEP
jgi:hypothetical protein